MSDQNIDLSRIHQNMGKVFERTQDAILVLKGQTFVACNDACIDMFNANSREQILDTHPSVLSPEYQPCGKASYIKANEMIANAAENGFHRFEWMHRKFTKEDFPVEVSLFPIEADGNEEDLIWAVCRDLTLEKKTNKELLHKSKLASIGQLAAGVGHEINNPLAILDGNLERLITKLESLPEVLREIQSETTNIEVASERIRKIVDGLRVYSRVDSEKVSAFSVNQAIQQTLNLITDIYSKEGIEIKTILPKEELCVRGLSGNLQQVLMNLISNAKDAVELSENKRINIELKAYGDTQVELSVEDSGSGIPAEIRQKILSPFFTTKDIGRGTGLGLSFVSEHIKEMKGDLSILSKNGKGSKFIVRLPKVHDCSEDNCEPDCPVVNPPHILPEELKLSGRALVVDDEPQIREIIGDYIESFGLAVDFAENGEQALTMIAPNTYRFIFSDMKMPGLSGIDFIKEAQKKTNSNTKYIVVTGGVSFDRPEELRPHLDKYINGFVAKPFTREAIQKVISQTGSTRTDAPVL